MRGMQNKSDSMNKYIKHVVQDAISCSPDKALTSDDIVDCAQRKFSKDIGTMVRALLVMGQQMGNVRASGIDRYLLKRGRELDAMVNMCSRKQKRCLKKKRLAKKRKCKAKRKCPIPRCNFTKNLNSYLNQVKRERATNPPGQQQEPLN